jgi:hypothetical protein
LSSVNREAYLTMKAHALGVSRGDVIWQDDQEIMRLIRRRSR